MKFKISVVMPCYNSEIYIEKTINSIVNQTYKNFELIIVDDGSTDNTIDELERLLLGKDIRYKIIKQINSGVSSARNTGIKNATGEYLYFIDSDDYMNAKMFEKMVNTIDLYNSDIVFCGFDKVNSINEVARPYNKRYGYINYNTLGAYAVMKMLKEQIWICVGSGIYKRDLISRHNILFTEKCYNGEDQEFIIKCLFHASKVSSIKETLFYYVQRENSFLHTYSLKKLSVLGFVNRITKYMIENNADERIVTYLKYNKFQKEYVRNVMTMYKYIDSDKTLNKIICNDKFNRRISKFKPIIFNKYELIFWIRLRKYLHMSKKYRY